MLVALTASLTLRAAVPGRAYVTPTFVEYPVPTANSSPVDLAAGPDGNMWFVEQSASKIGRITPDGAVTEFPISNGGPPLDVTAGPAGSLWFTEDRIGGWSVAYLVGLVRPA